MQNNKIRCSEHPDAYLISDWRAGDIICSEGILHFHRKYFHRRQVHRKFIHRKIIYRKIFHRIYFIDSTSLKHFS